MVPGAGARDEVDLGRRRSAAAQAARLTQDTPGVGVCLPASSGSADATRVRGPDPCAAPKIGRVTRTTNPGIRLTVEDDSHVIKIEEPHVPQSEVDRNPPVAGLDGDHVNDVFTTW